MLQKGKHVIGVGGFLLIVITHVRNSSDDTGKVTIRVVTTGPRDRANVRKYDQQSNLIGCEMSTFRKQKTLTKSRQTDNATL